MALGNKEIMAENILRLMSEQNKDRVDICRDLNFKYTTFTDWIKANTYPRIDKIEMMADYFGVTKADLVEKYNGSVDSIINKLDMKAICQLNDVNISKLNTYSKKLLELQKLEEEPVLMAAHNDNPDAEELEKIKSDMDLLKKHK